MIGIWKKKLLHYQMSNETFQIFQCEKFFLHIQEFICFLSSLGTILCNLFSFHVSQNHRIINHKVWYELHSISQQQKQRKNQRNASDCFSVYSFTPSLMIIKPLFNESVGTFFTWLIKVFFTHNANKYRHQNLEHQQHSSPEKKKSDKRRNEAEKWKAMWKNKINKEAMHMLSHTPSSVLPFQIQRENESNFSLLLAPERNASNKNKRKQISSTSYYGGLPCPPVPIGLNNQGNKNKGKQKWRKWD